MTDEGERWWDFLTSEGARDRRNLRLLMETVRELYTALDPQERMRHAVDRALELTGAERGFLLLEQSGELVPMVARRRDGKDLPPNLRYSRSAVREAWTRKELFRVIDPSDAARMQLGQSLRDLRIASIMVTPLQYEGHYLGVLYLDATYRAAADFTESEEKVFRTIGGLISAALENARLENARAERDHISQQIRLARDVQTRLLPQDDLPQAEGFELAGEGRVCDALSGDYYDVIPCPDGRLVLVVGDVSGHGISQALYSAMTRGQLHLLVQAGEGTGPVLERLNEFLVRDMCEEEFMSLFVSVLDPKTRSLVYASAGHNPPLLRRAGGGVQELKGTGRILGMWRGESFRSSEVVTFDPGDVLVLFTDGLFEAPNATGDRYGEERLGLSLEAHGRAGLCADGILRGLFSDLDAFRGGCPLEDDITALVVRAVPGDRHSEPSWSPTS